MKKAELLKQALENITQAMRGYENMPGDYFFDVAFEVKQARALVEALESLRWANIFYTNPQVPGEVGVEYEKFSDAYQAHTDVKKISLSIPFETVGIIRLKYDEQ